MVICIVTLENLKMSTTNKEDYVWYIQYHYDQEHVVKCQLITEEIL